MQKGKSNSRVVREGERGNDEMRRGSRKGRGRHWYWEEAIFFGPAKGWTHSEAHPRARSLLCPPALHAQHPTRRTNQRCPVNPLMGHDSLARQRPIWRLLHMCKDAVRKRCRMVLHVSRVSRTWSRLSTSMAVWSEACKLSEPVRSA
eukprot:355690-Chlamydomonas_euryale.AAC.5